MLGDAAADAAMTIRHLCKDFKTTDGYTKRAVDDLNLDVAGSKVTALLGASPLRLAWNSSELAHLLRSHRALTSCAAVAAVCPSVHNDRCVG